MSWTHARSRVARTTKSIKNGELPPDTPQLEEAYRDLRAARLADHVEKVVAGWPPLSDAQLARIAALLTAGAAGGDHATG